MANAIRGEVSLPHAGKTYTLVLSVNSLCELEDLLRQRVSDIILKVANPAASDLTTMRGVFWAALRHYHPEISLLDAGAILHAVGLPAGAEILREAVERAFPPPEEAKGPLAQSAAIGNGAHS